LIAELCKQLHGLPLAIELAAGWSNLLSPQQLLEQMQQPSMVLSQGPLDLGNARLELPAPIKRFWRGWQSLPAVSPWSRRR
jgi:predicted ATPase